MKLNNTDLVALNDHNDSYFLDKGADFYINEKYEEAIEYYRIAASMSNHHAISNLGYCYLYGHGVKKNSSLALAYFEMSLKMGNINSMYKLGQMYMEGNGMAKDSEIGNYYYNMALNAISREGLNPTIFPGLFYNVAKENMPGKSRNENKFVVFDFLHIAEEGYTDAIYQGEKLYEEDLEATMKLMDDKYFDDIREEYYKDAKSNEDDCGCSHHCHCHDEE